MIPETWLPQIFMALMGVAMFAYVVLDGFDLGVGMLLPRAAAADQDLMVAAIGPFWDANETWLVLGVGILLVAFPKAHGLVLGALYLPVTVMLIGLILRGAAFDFRVKAHDRHKALWNRAFFLGSLIASGAQGWMLGRYVCGFAEGWAYLVFATLIALALPATYLLLGACWLVYKTAGPLQEQAVRWARGAAWPMAAGLALISLATPWVSTTVRARWFEMPGFIALLPIPLACAAAFVALLALLASRKVRADASWAPFLAVVFIVLMGSCGLAYSLYPWVVMERLTLWQAAAAPASLRFILFGVALTLPAILAYTVFAYRVFAGKASALHYG